MFRIFSACFFALCVWMPISAEYSISPKEALKRLMDGNGNYTKDKLEHPNRNQDRRDEVASNHTPFAVIVGCSDSRVSPEIIFDQGIGDLFIVRVAGNVAGDIEVSSVEYATDYLGASLVMVLGHENCGAVKAVLSHNAKSIQPIAKRIEVALKQHGKPGNNELETATKANVMNVVEELKKVPSLARLIDAKKLEIVGGYYHLGTGKVELCCVPQ